jgi:undecaprenyl-diphosphatase
MTIPQAIVYGIVQGLTEFLPVSSTAHLRIVPELFHWNDPGAAFTAVIQLGTVLAVLIYFWKDLTKAFMGLFSKDKNSIEYKTGWAVFIATIPICVLALVLKKYIEGDFRSLYVIGSSLIFMGVLMWIVEKKFEGNRTLEDVTLSDGIKVGLMQCIALIPGMSRSGSSITGAFFAGFNKESATRLSFLMSVPAIAIAGIYEGIKDGKHITSEGMLIPTLVATTISFIVGYACIKWLIGFVARRGLTPFVAYRIVVGVLLIGLCVAGVLNPKAKEEVSEKTSSSSNSSRS